MTIQDWGSVGELVGGLAIIISLLYVGLQVRQSTGATRAATNQAFSEQFSSLILRLTRDDVRDIFRRGVAGLRNLQDGEQVAFMALLSAIMRTYETFYFERTEGRFDSKMYDGYLRQLLDLYATEGAQEYWAIRKHQFTDEFGRYLDEQCESYNSRSMYGGES